MRMITFAKRCTKEILRDPINLCFGLGFPLVLILLLNAIQANIPVSLFEIDRLTPGISVFGLSFVTLFSATLISKDRESALLQRLYTTPLTSVDFILGYMLPILPMALCQSVVCYIFAIEYQYPLCYNRYSPYCFVLRFARSFVRKYTRSKAGRRYLRSVAHQSFCVAFGCVV